MRDKVLKLYYIYIMSATALAKKAVALFCSTNFALLLQKHFICIYQFLWQPYVAKYP